MEKVDDEFGIHAVFASVDICADKSPFGKCMYTNMTLGNSHYACPSTWVFDTVIVSMIHHRL